MSHPSLLVAAILGVADVQDVINHACVCRECRRKCLQFKIVSVGIASQPIVCCLNCEKNMPERDMRQIWQGHIVCQEDDTQASQGPCRQFTICAVISDSA